MEDDLNKTEEMLRSLAPRRLSPSVETALLRLGQEDESSRDPGVAVLPRPMIRWISWGVAASLFFALGIGVHSVWLRNQPAPAIAGTPVPKPAPLPAEVHQETVRPQPQLVEVPQTKASPDSLQPEPIELETTVVALRPEGVAPQANSSPVYRMRRQYIKTVRIRDPATGRVILVHEPLSDTVPLEESEGSY